jgi:hypothetical protein
MPHESSTIRWSASWKEAEPATRPASTGASPAPTSGRGCARRRPSAASCPEERVSSVRRRSSGSLPESRRVDGRRERDGRRQREQPAAEAGHLFFIGRPVARLRDRRPRLRISAECAHSVCSSWGSRSVGRSRRQRLRQPPGTRRHVPTRSSAGRRPRASPGQRGRAVRRGVAPCWSSPTAGRRPGRRPTGVRGPPGAGRGRLLHPAPYSTRGEAEAFARLADRRGWRSVVVVSSRYHLLRARMLFERCYDGKVVERASNGTLLGRILAAPIETVKLGYALLLREGLRVRRRDRPAGAAPDRFSVSADASGRAEGGPWGTLVPALVAPVEVAGATPEALVGIDVLSVSSPGQDAPPPRPRRPAPRRPWSPPAGPAPPT